jgi:hypothetical protein
MGFFYAKKRGASRLTTPLLASKTTTMKEIRTAKIAITLNIRNFAAHILEVIAK